MAKDKSRLGMTSRFESDSVNCKICETSAHYLCETYNEHSKSSTLHHYRCQECGLVFVGDQLDTQELGEAYSTLERSLYYEEIKQTNQKKLLTSAEDLARIADKRSKVVDIGTGNGAFLQVLHERGFRNLAAHEIPGGAITAADELACAVYRDHDYESVPSNAFDVVTLLDVAEHVPDPRFLFHSCYRMLKPGGWVYFHTPVVTGMDRLMHHIPRIGPMWQRGRTSIFHLQNYTKPSLRNVLGSAGFGHVRINVANELSWPVSRYVRVYLIEKQGLPRFLTNLLTPLAYPLLATNTFNANKATVWAKKPVSASH